jgi:valyl-tRNA synthetase
VYLNVKGCIDIDREITKAQDRLKKTLETAEKQKNIMDANWEARVSNAVREQEKEKLKTAETERRNREASIGQFKRPKLR